MRPTYSDDKSSSYCSFSHVQGEEICGESDDSEDSEDWSSSYVTEEEEPDNRSSDDASLNALMHAAEIGDLENVEIALTKLTLPCSTLSHDGDTALHLACLFGHETVVQKLLAFGADVNKKDSGGAIALHDACASGHIRIAERLLEAAPESIHVVDEDGDTALHNAARGNHIDLVRLLLRNGASSDVKIVNLDGESPFDTTEDPEIQDLLAV